MEKSNSMQIQLNLTTAGRVKWTEVSVSLMTELPLPGFKRFRWEVVISLKFINVVL